MKVLSALFLLEHPVLFVTDKMLEQGYSTNFNEGPVGEVWYFLRSSRIFDLQ